ncbi:MAG TPA: peptidoglycan DD-metalloendopeptidase family protein [Rhodanobacteraceae bacterium]
MLESMFASTRIRACLLSVGVAAVVTGCGVPPLHRSVVVQTNDDGMPVHASGQIAHDHYTVVRGDTLFSIAFRAQVDYHQLARWNGISAPYRIYPGEVLRLSAPPAQTVVTAQTPVFQTVVPAAAPAPAVPDVPSQAAKAVVSTAGKRSAAETAPTTVVAAARTPVVPDAAGASIATPGATRAAAGIAWRWPAAGTVTNHFVQNSTMPGITIAGTAGEPVRAAADGVVLYSGNGLVGYGELVVIRHKNHYMSVYGHNGKRLVEEGAHVKAGQIIARMGSVGAARDELEFQIRYKGKPVDPMSFLPQR